MNFVHKPVLLRETIDILDIKPNGIYIDATVGAGGHSGEIAKRLDETGKLFCFDKDPDAIDVASHNLRNFKNVKVIHSDFCDIKSIWDNISGQGVDGILMDLGVSSYQLDNPERGFSYHVDSTLDMRMSKDGISAYDLVNSLSCDELSKIIYEYGEERFAKRIASNIVYERQKKPIKSTLQLSEIIKKSLPEKIKRGEKHPARKTFQALRIAVNDELNRLEHSLDEFIDILNIGGILAVITFHSLEDRIVKQKINFWRKDCICPPDFPICVCDKVKRVKQCNRKPIVPSENEISNNKRSRSAKLRACKKVC